MKGYKYFHIFVGILLFVVLVVLGYLVFQRTSSKPDHTVSSDKLAKIINNLTPKDWQIYDEVSHFTAENLYEQINGRAEYYIAYDVIGLTFVSFEKKTDNDISINVSIYDMGEPIHAFGAFSGERSLEGERIKLGRDAYRSGANYYIWHGQYYIQIIALYISKELTTVGREFAEQLTTLLPDSGEPVWGLAALPKGNRIPQSVQYFVVDAMGLDFMHRTYTAKYQKYETELTVFLSQKQSSESAQITLNNYSTYATDYGKGIHAFSKGDIQLISCKIGSHFDIIFKKESLIAGVTGVEDENIAIQAAIDLWNQL